jgi:hypothetical protein
VPQEFFGWIHRSFPPDVSITLLGIHTARASSGGFEPCLFVSLFMAKPLGVVGEPQPAQGELTPRRSIVEAWGCFRELQAFAGTPVVRIHGEHRRSALTKCASARPTPMSTLGHTLNRVPPGLFRDGAKIGAPDVNELLPAALQIASNNKKQVHATAKFNAE